MREKSIGAIVRLVVKQRGVKADELARILKVSRPNVFSIYRRSSIDTSLLERLSVALEYNFFEHFSAKYHQFEPKPSGSSLRDSELTYLRQAMHDKDELFAMAKRQIHLLSEMNAFRHNPSVDKGPKLNKLESGSTKRNHRTK